MTISLEKKLEIISQECLQYSGSIPRCIDERGPRQDIDTGNFPDCIITTAQFNGPQFLGGSLGILALLAEASTLEFPEREIDFETLYEEVLELHQSLDLQPGVHMDDHGGKMTPEEMVMALENIQKGRLGEPSIIPGCGFAGLLSNEKNPLGLSSQSSEFFQKNPNCVDEFVRRGAKISIVAGNHASQENVCAVENMREGMTLHTWKAFEKGYPTFNHDTGTLESLLKNSQRNVHEILEINKRWLYKTTNILAGMDPVVL